MNENLNQEIWDNLSDEGKKYVGTISESLNVAIALHPDAEPKGRKDDAIWAAYYINLYVSRA